MMMRPFSAIGRRLKRLWRREDGTATIEFCFAIPITLLIFMASMESGLYMVRSALLERGLDMVIREYRLGRLENMTYEDIRNRICDYTVYVANCDNNLKVWIQPISTTTWALPARGSVRCTDRNEPLNNPAIAGAINPTGAQDLALIRVCVLEDPIFPTTHFAARLQQDSSGKYELASATIVVTEPR
ncbi:pilus assembly protein [Xinfangfangia sp. D13-10-4-6]|uniref:TadE/TadG family type IV pilus assembly protein n=1 Tax=Pseudogemmobacter hezensis TaxID=2737662 RepID=UPI001552FC88|nr:pilus assembly protein [Pseudogemmobacter hezensis]NPD13968.1 pilus assembly protein [Pseudogemmobacter hezensis]